jgi:Protein of unknown function (DUF5818)
MPNEDLARIRVSLPKLLTKNNQRLGCEPDPDLAKRTGFWQAGCSYPAGTTARPEDIVKKRIEFFSVAALFAVVSCGTLLHAQQNNPGTQPSPAQAQPAPTQPPDTEAPQPGQQTPSQAQPPQTPSENQSPTPDSMSQSGSNGVKEFVGTVVKQGDKYVFQEASTGTTYDIDHQDEVKKFEGKKVRVHGTLDPSTKTIHLQ